MKTRGKRFRIAWIEAIRTLSGGGEIYKLKNGQLLPIEDRISKIFDITFLRYPSIREYISLKRLIPHKIKFSLKIALYLLKDNPDLLVAPGLPQIEGVMAFLLGKLQRRPIILKDSHWYWPDTCKSRLLWPIGLFLSKNAAILLVPGKRVREYWKRVGISETKIKIGLFYISLLDFSKLDRLIMQTLNEKFGEKLVILYLGRLIKKKGLEYLIQAFARLKKDITDTVLIIVGDGPERNKLEALCSSFNLTDVVFVGSVGERDKLAYFMIANVFVYPSITLETPEEWGLGVIEAMSVGKPVIVTTATGCALDVVQNGINGYIVPERDWQALYKAIKMIANDANLRKSMGIESKKIIKSTFNYDYAVEAMVQAIGSVYKRKDSDH